MKMNKQIIGFDFDGVIATETKGWFSDLMWKICPKFWAIIVHSLARHTGIVPEEGAYIITGRMGCETKLTLKQLNKWGIKSIQNFDSSPLNAELIIDYNKNFPDRESSLEQKKEAIRDYGITIYHENDPLVIEGLKKEFGDKLTIFEYETKI